MFDLIKGWDLNGKPVTFYYKTSTVHKTVFGGLLSVTSFTLMFTIAITTLVNFFLQKPIINSNIVFYINKKSSFFISLFSFSILKFKFISLKLNPFFIKCFLFSIIFLY